MKTLLFITSNPDKFIFGSKGVGKSGVKLEQSEFDIDEIQSENAEKIIRDKAHKSFDILKKPLIVSDDSWSIPALNGFPGPYMKSVNSWFEPADFLNLMRDKTDKKIYLIQRVIYQDSKGQKLFTKKIEGKFLEKIDDIEHRFPIAKVVSLTSNGMSLGRIRYEDPERLADETANVWDDVAEWLKENIDRI